MRPLPNHGSRRRALTAPPEAMQGLCEGEVPAAIASAAADPPLAPRKTGQCVLLTKDRAFQFVGSGNSRAWVDNLYVRLVWPQNNPAVTHVNIIGADTYSIWFTNTTIQGDSSVDFGSRAVDPWKNARLYFGGAPAACACVCPSAVTPLARKVQPALTKSAVFVKPTGVGMALSTALTALQRPPWHKTPMLLTAPDACRLRLPRPRGRRGPRGGRAQRQHMLFRPLLIR